MNDPTYAVKKHKGLGWMVYKGGAPLGDPMRGPFYARRMQAVDAALKLTVAARSVLALEQENRNG